MPGTPGAATAPLPASKENREELQQASAQEVLCLQADTLTAQADVAETESQIIASVKAACRSAAAANAGAADPQSKYRRLREAALRSRACHAHYTRSVRNFEHTDSADCARAHLLHPP